MIREERLLKVILAPHISEKSTIAAEENNTIVFKVASDATKAEIKAAAEKLFEVDHLPNKNGMQRVKHKRD